MSGAILATELVGAQQHGPPAAAHVVLLVGAAVILLVILGVSRRRRRQDAAAAEEQPTSHGLSTETALAPVLEPPDSGESQAVSERMRAAAGRSAYFMLRSRASYDVPSSWHSLSTEQKETLHGDYHAVAASPGVIGHYRLRPPEMMTTIRVQEDQIVKTEGPLADTTENLRALYLLESDDHDSVLELAARIPAARMGGAVEVWPLTER